MIFIVSLNSKCQNKNEIEKYLKGFRDQYEIVRKYKDCDVIVYDKSESTMNIQARCTTKDTLILLELYKYFENQKWIYELKGVSKMFNRNKSEIDFQVYDLHDRLKYWYLYDAKDESKKKFIIGKYLFLYEKGGLNAGQDKYFEAHQDSLSKIKGDNLPDLPDH